MLDHNCLMLSQTLIPSEVVALKSGASTTDYTDQAGCSIDGFQIGKIGEAFLDMIIHGCSIRLSADSGESLTARNCQ